MKKYRDVSISSGFYLSVLIIYFINSQLEKSFTWQLPISETRDIIVILILGILSIIPICGIFFAHKSNVRKESTWAGNFLIAIGLFMLLFLVWAYVMDSGINGV